MVPLLQTLTLRSQTFFFEGNEAVTGGGGIFYGSGILNFANVTFGFNLAREGGGGWYCQKQNEVSNIIIKSNNVTFTDNLAQNCLEKDVGGSCSGNFSQCASKTTVPGCEHCEGRNCVIDKGAHCFDGNKANLDSCLCYQIPGSPSNSVGAIVGGVLGGIFLIIIIVVAYIYFRRTTYDYQEIPRQSF